MLNRRMQSLMLRRVPALSEQSTVVVSSSASRAATQSDVQFAIRRIAAFPAIIQALKGIISAGILPSISYALRKLRKGILKF
ncbi:hypothetical protein GQ42DRAFT_162906 [Ramicandelaber brevisporus]|nr:hypothetical protein GQ42DRAFT_162906 [Ramicandelaber brevisporus]